MRSSWVWLVAALSAGCTGSQVPSSTVGGDMEAAEGEEAFVAPSGRRLAVGVLLGCVVGEDQRARCWHEADPLAPRDAPGPAPAVVPGLGEVAEVAAAGTRACALRVDGTVLCWTEEPPDLLGGGGAAPVPEPTEVGLDESLHVSVGGLGVCAIHRHGEVRCTGFEGIGGEGGEPLGDGVFEVPRAAPATDVSVGGSSVCALRAGGQVVCWARGEEPAPVSGVVGATGVSVGDGFACAVEGSGRVLCWGEGSDGQLGDGESRSSPSPVPVTGIDDAAEVAVAGGDRMPGVACARRQSGELLCWGGLRTSRSGGDSTAEGAAEPVAVVGLAGAHELAIGGEACIRRAEEGVACWRPGATHDGEAPELRLIP